MNKKLRPLLVALVLAASCVMPVSALEYTIDAPDVHLFGRSTSTDTVYTQESQNVDRSKSVALIPPGFGTATSYLPGSGEYLTPNLVPGAVNGGGLVNQTGPVSYPTVDTGAPDSPATPTIKPPRLRKLHPIFTTPAGISAPCRFPPWA